MTGHREASDPVGYGSYLRLTELLDLQRPLSTPTHPDELLFIVVHQVSELWFKVMLHELRGLTAALESHEAGSALWRIGRLDAVMRIVSGQLSALETLPPQHFAEFRGYLGTSSGAQSMQFRAIEAAAGLRDNEFVRALDEDPHVPAAVRDALTRPTLEALFVALVRDSGSTLDALYTGPGPSMLYFLAEALLEFEQQVGQWRFAHVQLVERIIGPLTVGTGGVAGSPLSRGHHATTVLPGVVGRAARTPSRGAVSVSRLR
ncbi:MAG: tryptophan 2,3-dioxygenase family protein [Gemmatimonadaceae bacterium]